VTLEQWDPCAMRLAAEAASWSKDARKQVGAVLVDPTRRRFAFGCNGLPGGFPDDVVMDRDRKNRYSLHAEENAIANAATDVRGWTMYVTTPPCLRCALAIHRAGITRIMSPALDINSLWYEDQVEAEEFLASMGIEQWRRECA
jgi:dCMP deaminase